MELPQIQKEKHLTKKEIESLFPFVNKSSDWQIDLNSFEFIEKIIELWFNQQGYDFWNNPYPEVTETTITKENEIIFKYLPQ